MFVTMSATGSQKTTKFAHWVVILVVLTTLGAEQAARKVIERKPGFLRETTLSPQGEKVIETLLRDGGNDTASSYSTTKLFVDGVRVYVEVRNGTNAPFRAYGKAGDLFLIEEDSDVDGFFETLILYGKDRRIAAVLTRAKDGKIEAASQERTQHVLDSRKAFDKTVRPVMQEMLRRAGAPEPDKRLSTTPSK